MELDYKLIPVDFNPFADGELEKVIPISESQQEIWLACALGADDANCAYNESITIRFDGVLDIPSLVASILIVIGRHEALRATFSHDGEEMFVYNEKHPSITHVDLADSPDRQQELTQLAEEDSSLPFDLEKGPLIRFHVIKLHEIKHVLRITAHHIICDGWSFGILLEDLGKIYSSLVGANAPQLDAPESMRLYALDAKNYLRTPEYQETEAYWLRKFEDVVPVVELPIDLPRPVMRTYNGNRIDRPLDNQLVDKIKKLGLAAGANLVTTLLSSFELFLRDITHQDDLVVGLPASGQAATGRFELVGHCVNFLPIRARIDQAKSVLHYIKQRKSELLSDLDYQRITFGSLLKKLNPPRKPGYIPLVSVVFNVDMGMDSRVAFAELKHELASNPRSFENFELYLNVTGSAGSMVLEWSYNTNLFKEQTIQRWIRRFINFLAELADHPEASISTIGSTNSVNQSESGIADTTVELALTKLPGINEAVVARDSGQMVTYFTMRHDTLEAGQSSWKEKWNLLYDMAANAGGTAENKGQNLDLVVAEQLGSQDETVKQQAEEWMQQSIERILAVAPRHILEVGCGAGQLIFELAPHVTSYIATDYAETAITDLKNKLSSDADRPLNHITAFVRDADDFSHLPEQPTDLILVHSVSQYFPNYQYLYNLIIQAVSHMEKGCVFIGDVQGKNSLPLFHAGDQLQRSNPKTMVGQFKKIVQNRVKLEHELTIDPGYFYLLPTFIPEITAVDVQLRKGMLDNETTKYHYDVWLHTTDEISVVSPTLTNSWQSAEALDHLLTHNHNEIICLTHIPNPRLRRDVALHHFMVAAADDDTIGQFQATAEGEGILPNTLWRVGEKHGFNTHVRWSTDGTDGLIEAVFIPQSLGKAVPAPPTGIVLAGVALDTFTNLPHGSTPFLPQEIVNGWKSALREDDATLSIPEKWIELDKLPKNKSDVIDRRALLKYFPATFPLPPKTKETQHTSAWWADQLYRERALETSLTTWINTALQQYSERVALEHEGESMTYGELLSMSGRYANQLLAMGVNTGDRVGISLYRGFDLVAMVTAILRIGATYVPLDITFPKQRIAAITAQADLKCIVVHQALIHQHDCDQPIVSLEDFARAAQTALDQLSDIAIPDDAMAYVLHTSGSTGKPKGVAMGQRALTNLLLWHREHSNADMHTKTLQFAPITFDVSFQEIFSTLTTGGTLCLIPEEMRYDIPELLRHIDKESVNRIFLPFVALHALAEYGCTSDIFPVGLREVITAGEQLKITDKVARFFSHLPNASLSNHYGPTETHVVTALKLDGNPANWPAIPTIGTPIYNTRIHLLDTNQQPVGAGEIGELCVEGVALADGYLGAPHLTAERFMEITTNGKATRIYRTGDLAQYDGGGNLVFLGRGDSQVKIRGYRVELGEIESELTKLEGIGESVVQLIEDTAGVKRLVAYVLLKNHPTSVSPGSSPAILPEAIAETQLKTWKLALARTLPDYMVPHTIVAINHFPTTPSGKIDRKALPSPSLLSVDQSQQIADFVAPRNATELFLADIWEEALGLEVVGVHSDFFELGGYSLIAVKVMLAIEKQRGIRLPLSSLFENPTIAKLSKLISGDDEQVKWDSLVPIRTEGTKPPIYLVHGGGLNVLVFQSMAKYLDEDQPVYAMQALGLNGEATLFDNMQQIADKYIQEILVGNPDGPYCLAGYSLGGKIVYEMARQLLAMGKQVEMVGIFDTVASNDIHHENRLKWFTQKLVRQFRKIPFFVKTFMAYPAETLAYQRLILLEKIKDMVTEKTYNELESFTYNKEILVSYLNAYDNYWIEPLDIQIDLFRVTKRLYFLDDPEYLGWNNFAKKGVKVHDVPGDHKTFILPPHDQALAIALQRCLDEKIQRDHTTHDIA
ncbi:non-ribosomal peptide synthetase [Parapedobacter tibetensis]|uniref:non-ribosomal peptide synthetase n=1 Tax=Parapedobacter tibetensis TaxID=2972951 RepID=UPI00214D66FE|nr:non-ribosomal peptide synthetase [Parapedobacter tibetensis]